MLNLWPEDEVAFIDMLGKKIFDMIIAYTRNRERNGKMSSSHLYDKEYNTIYFDNHIIYKALIIIDQPFKFNIISNNVGFINLEDAYDKMSSNGVYDSGEYATCIVNIFCNDWCNKLKKSIIYHSTTFNSDLFRHVVYNPGWKDLDHHNMISFNLITSYRLTFNKDDVREYQMILVSHNYDSRVIILDTILIPAGIYNDRISDLTLLKDNEKSYKALANNKGLHDIIKNCIGYTFHPSSISKKHSFNDLIGIMTDAAIFKIKF